MHGRGRPGNQGPPTAFEMLQSSGPGGLRGVFLARCLFLLLLPSRCGLVNLSQAFRVRFLGNTAGAPGSGRGAGTDQGPCDADGARAPAAS